MDGPSEQPTARKPEVRMAAVLLAAGQGVRMGGISKPLIRVQGVPLISRHYQALQSAGFEEVVVVTGHAHHAIQDALRNSRVTWIRNLHPERGQNSSVRLGLQALSGPLDGVMVMLADLPWVGTEDMVELVRAFQQRTQGHVLVPRVHGQRGNPVLLDGVALKAVLASEPHLGPRDLMDSTPGMVVFHESSKPCFVTDLDTREDAMEFARMTGWTVELPQE